MDNLSVSIIVNTLGRAELLNDTLCGLSALRWPNFEIVVVNGPSQDDTEQVLQQWAETIKIGRCAEANLAMSRNIGLSLAGGDIVAFIDDDAIPHPAWLEQLTEAYRDPRVGGAGGHTIGRMGSRYQARTTLCDRFGDPYFVSDDLDLSRFCQPGSWAFPSLLGTNSSFRRTALQEVGGFDETFSYYLEETDLCLRLVDAGWQIVSRPDALIWHQFASSALRTSNMTRRSIKAVMRSQSYFINRHGLDPWSPAAAQSAAERLVKLRDDWLRGNRAAQSAGVISARHAARLDRELIDGMAEGFVLSRRRSDSALGHWAGNDPPACRPFVPARNDRLTIAFICRDYNDGRESGIPRWTRLLAQELARRGHMIHIVCETKDVEPSIRFSRGIWTHEIPSDSADYQWLCERFGLPNDQAQWAASARAQIQLIQSFGLDIVSFPIWNVEGIACLGLTGVTVSMSLHTTYGIVENFRPDWAAQPIVRDQLVAPMKAVERMALAKVPHLLANSSSIIQELETLTGLDLASKAALAIHGVPVPPADATAKHGHQIIYVGRFEMRKGIDLALAAFVAAANANPALSAVFVGGEYSRELVAANIADQVETLRLGGRLEFAGMVTRETLEGLFAVADVALLPSRYESFGLVAAEALSHGCAVAGLNCGGIAEVVQNGATGILVTPDDEAATALADALVDLFADPAKLRGIQAAARQAAQTELGLAKMAQDVETAFATFRSSEVHDIL